MANFRIKELCKEKGITQKELAEKIGLTAIGLAKASSGNPTIETLERISQGLGVPVTDLFEKDSQIRTIICPDCKQEIPIEAEIKVVSNP